MAVKIYAIRNRTSDLVYVGRTTKHYLSQRLAGHLYDYRQHQRGNCKWVSAYQVLSCPTAYIELLEECEVGIAKQREAYWVSCFPSCVNSQVPNRSYAQWVSDNRDHVRAYGREKMREYRKRKSNA